jgi:hypothetical protein
MNRYVDFTPVGISVELPGYCTVYYCTRDAVLRRTYAYKRIGKVFPPRRNRYRHRQVGIWHTVCIFLTPVNYLVFQIPAAGDILHIYFLSVGNWLLGL